MDRWNFAIASLGIFFSSFLNPIATHAEKISEVSPTPLQQESIDKHYIFYLLQSQEWKRGIDLYRKYKELLGHHDVEILAQMLIKRRGI